MRYRATHTTHYAYETAVSQCLSEARLTPRALPWQTLVESRIQTTPEPASVTRHKDYFGNEVTSFTIVERHDRFTTVATSLVDVAERTRVEPAETPWEDGARRTGGARSPRGARGVRVHPGVALCRDRSPRWPITPGRVSCRGAASAPPPWI